MITHCAIWRKSLNTPVFGFIGSTTMTAVGRNNACQKIPYRDRMVLRDCRPLNATIGMIFYRNTCPMEKTSSSSRSAHKSHDYSRTIDATLGRTCQDCEVVAQSINVGFLQREDVVFRGNGSLPTRTLTMSHTELVGSVRRDHASARTSAYAG
jgi:hypothetical protein